jgi:hypothetical protein
MRSVVWEEAPFAKLQVLPSNAKEVVKWRNIDEAFKNITVGIAEAATRLAPQYNDRSEVSTGTSSKQSTNTRDIASVLQDMTFVLIPAGTFRMGSKEEIEDAIEDEKPDHEVQNQSPRHAESATPWEWQCALGRMRGRAGCHCLSFLLRDEGAIGVHPDRVDDTKRKRLPYRRRQFPKALLTSIAPREVCVGQSSPRPAVSRRKRRRSEAEPKL